MSERERRPSLEELEARVPDRWVASMPGDVRREMARRAAARRGGAVRRWTVPLLAAATVTLLVASGVMYRALVRAEGRQAELAAQLLDQQRRLAVLESGAGEAPRATPATGSRALRGPGLTGGDAWLRGLEARGEVTLAELREALRELPADTRLMRASRARALGGSRLLPGAWREAFAGLDGGGEVTAADLLGVLDRLDLPGGTSVPTGRLIELLG